MANLPDDIARDVQAIGRIDAVPKLLQVVCETTGMGFAAVARVTEDSWTACAVQDDISFGLQPGGQLDVNTTLCRQVRASNEPVVIDHASEDAVYRDHHTPRLYNIQSYISVPIVLGNGDYFGNLCAIDPRPVKLSEPRTIALFKLLAELISVQLDNDRARQLDKTALLDAQAAGELREQFIAILGHDLRNPLAAVMGCAEVLQRKATTPEMAVNLGQRIATNARRMSGLIGDVLDFARGRLGGGFGVQMAPVGDLAEALRNVVSEARDAHRGRTIQTDIVVPGEVWCDRGRLQQLVSNLLANALTHGSPEVPVRLDVQVDDGALVIAVTNHGEPVPESQLPHLFGPFNRRSTSTREGLGLGLFICAQIAEAHGGSLSVASTRDDGTTFTARFPATPGR